MPFFIRTTKATAKSQRAGNAPKNCADHAEEAWLAHAAAAAKEDGHGAAQTGSTRTSAPGSTRGAQEAVPPAAQEAVPPANGALAIVSEAVRSDESRAYGQGQSEQSSRVEWLPSGCSARLWADSDASFGDAACCVQVRNIPSTMTVDGAVALLAEHGFSVSADGVRSVHVPCKRRTQTARGYFFAVVPNSALAEEVQRALDGMPMGTRALKVSWQFDERGVQRFDGVEFPEAYAPRIACNWQR